MSYEQTSKHRCISFRPEKGFWTSSGCHRYFSMTHKVLQVKCTVSIGWTNKFPGVGIIKGWQFSWHDHYREKPAILLLVMTCHTNSSIDQFCVFFPVKMSFIHPVTNSTATGSFLGDDRRASKADIHRRLVCLGLLTWWGGLFSGGNEKARSFVWGLADVMRWIAMLRVLVDRWLSHHKTRHHQARPQDNNMIHNNTQQ